MHEIRDMEKMAAAEKESGADYQPLNPYLLRTFQRFMREDLSVPEALAMTQAHLAHEANVIAAQQAEATSRAADALERLARLTDPVTLGEFLAFLKASEAKRAENKEERAGEAAKTAFDKLVTPEPTVQWPTAEERLKAIRENDGPDHHGDGSYFDVDPGEEPF